MMHAVKQLCKKYFPKHILNVRHWWYAWYGAMKYRHPSDHLLVIGVTGTSGKSTTVYILRTLLEKLGYIVGSLSTIDFYIAGEDKLNDEKMTMLGKMKIQAYLREMVDKGCHIAIIETTSEGAVQHRHRFINYDCMILTNLYPEHIESHGGFENYKQAKISLFHHTATYGRTKKLAHDIGFPMLARKGVDYIAKTALVDGDSIHASDFLSAGPFDQRYACGTGERTLAQLNHYFHLTHVSGAQDGISFALDGNQMHASMYGVHNAHNCAIACGVLSILGHEWGEIAGVTETLRNAPGRTEFITEAEEYGFRVIVDYAFEPKAIEALYDVVSTLSPRRIIHVFGSTGGGRDVSRRTSVGIYVGKHADICIVTDEDPYDDDPLAIIREVAEVVERVGKVPGKDLFVITDRKEAIERAIAMAEEGDLVLITGKGSEQGMCIGNGVMIPWDDRAFAREAIRMRTTDIRQLPTSLWSGSV